MSDAFCTSGSSPGTTSNRKPDFLLSSDSPHPTVYLLTPITRDAHRWIADHIDESNTLYLGSSVAIGHRYVEDILHGITEAGLVVRRG